MDYTVVDSSLYKDRNAYRLHDRKTTLISVGIIRSSIEVPSVGTKYIVDVYSSGNQIPMSCVPISRFNSPYNFEEIRYKPWLRGSASSGLLPAGSAGKYDFRDGTTVVVAPIDGSYREGVILGCIKHTSRETVTEPNTLAYHSVYNGVETKIDKDGAYTLTFQGAPLNDKADIPPGVTEIPEVKYNELISGSYLSFDKDGNFTIDVSSDQVINTVSLKKSPSEGSIIAECGNTVITITGTASSSEISVISDSLTAEVKELEIKANTSIKAESQEVSIKGNKVAIGSDSIELIDGLIQVLENLGKCVITSPVGTCAPIMMAPEWSSDVMPLISKFKGLKGSL